MNKACEERLNFVLTGNIIPIIWYKQIKKRVWDRKNNRWATSQQTDHIAIAILADILYWYLPSEVRNEETGELIGYKQKFKGEKLQKSYKSYGEMLNCPASTVKQSIDNLVNLGLINREFKTITTKTGLTLTNLMFLEPNIEAIKSITYPEDAKLEPEEKDYDIDAYSCDEQQPIPEQQYPPPLVTQEDVDGKDKETNTENTTKISIDNNIYNAPNDKKPKKTDKPQSYEEEVEAFFKSVQQQDWWDDFILAFPNVTTKGELTRAKVWLLSNQQKRKKNFKRFLYNWFSKAQDRYDRMRMAKGGSAYGRRSEIEAISERLDIASQRGEDRKDGQDAEKNSQSDICLHNPLITGTFGDGTPITGPF